MGKTILLAMPKIAKLDQLIAAGLQYHGFKVINIVYDDLDFQYPSLKANLYVKYRKLIHKDTTAKKKIKWQALQNKIAAKLPFLVVSTTHFLSAVIYTAVNL